MRCSWAGSCTPATWPVRAQYPATLTAPVPGLPVGSYHVIVVVDSGLQVPDINRANNTGVGSDRAVDAAADSDIASHRRHRFRERSRTGRTCTTG